MNALLKTIADNASEDLRKLIEEGADDILKAIHKTEQEAQANDAKPKFALGFKITLDFDAAGYNCDLSWSLKQTLGTTHRIEDPNQPKLELDPVDKAVGKFASSIASDSGVSSMTISTGDQSVTITKEDAKRIKKNLDRAQKN